MIEIRRILCPVDRSETSARALGYGLMLAGWYEASLTALEVIWVNVPPVSSSAQPVLSPAQLESFASDLRAFVDAKAPAGIDVTTTIGQGPVVTAILHEARTLPADLIVMGTHGHSGVERFLLGSVAEKTLRKATCPVLTIPPAAPDVPSSPEPFQSILCAIDFSPSSLKALEYALRLAEESGKRLTLLHVFDWDEDRLMPEQFDTTTRDIRQEHREATLERLRALVPDEVRTWCDCRELTATGRPHEEVVLAAAGEHADLIVIGAHGRRAKDVLLFGSTTNQVVRHATCPVLTIRT
jgi:nucleotide-binding universal stress UspA family protein